MEIKSSAVENGKVVSKYTCEGEGISPPLEISGVPESAKSLVFMIIDVDVPAQVQEKTGIKEWPHWVVFNIDPMTIELGEGAVPMGGIQGSNGSGKPQYEAPCPPKEMDPPKHRYYFRLFALDVEGLDLQEGAAREDIEKAMESHVLEKAELMGVYEKS